MGKEWLSWCEHMKPYVDDRWQFCPICGTPRPKEKSKRERLAEKIRFTRTQNVYSPTDDFDLALADCALNFLQTEGSND